MKEFKSFEFKSAKVERKHEDGRTIFRAVATTPALDRYGEVVLPRGAVVDNFLKNPVLVEIHDSGKSSIGHILKLDMSESEIAFDFVFSRDQRGQEMEQKYVEEDMHAFSIGFQPESKVDLWYPWDEEPVELREIKFKYPDKTEGLLDLTQYKKIPYRVYTGWELLEISPVTIPANPEALLMRQAEEIVRRAMDSNPVARSFVQAELAAALGPALKLLASFADKFDKDFAIDGAVAPHSTPVEKMDWNKSDARALLAQWASKSGGGAKEEINWAKYSHGFARFDSKNADSFGAYELPHHSVKDGSLVAVWGGVTEAMANELKVARGKADFSIKSASYEHLAKHYTDFGKVAPEYKEYTDEELGKIASDTPAEGEAPAAAPEGAQTAEKAADIATVTVKEDDPTEESSDKEEMGMMAKLLAKLDEIAIAVNALAKAQAEESETSTESFISLNLRLRVMQDCIEQNMKNAPPKKESATPTEPEVLTTVSADIITELERVART